LEGGKDSAAARYIFTALAPIQSTLISKADDPGLSWLEDDGQRVEPEYYMPVLPLLLVNGADGIGTGYSSKVLSYSPRDLVAALRCRLSGTVADLTETVLTPWYDGFRGPVVVSADGRKVTTEGLFQFFDDEGCRVRITELPVGVWTKNYKAFLEKMLEGEEETKAKGKDADSVVSAGVKILKSFQEGYTDDTVEFTLTLEPEYYHEARTFPAEFKKKFRLTKSTTLSNMVAFDVDGLLRRFGSVGSILEMFYVRRLGGYVNRKASELARLDAEIMEIDARARFVKAVVTGELVVANATDEALLAGLKGLGLPPLSSLSSTTTKEAADLRGYEYLLRMRVDRLKAAAVLELESELATVKAARDALASKSAEELWLTDLGIFSSAYDAFMEAKVKAKADEEGVKAEKAEKAEKAAKAAKAGKVGKTSTTKITKVVKTAVAAST
jgi:DNA topoisomerase-2